MATPPRRPILADSSTALLRRLFVDAGRAYAGRYVLAFVFMAMVAASTATMAWIMRDVVDQIFVGQRTDELIAIAIAVTIIAIVRGIGAYGTAITLSRLGNSLVARMQSRLYDHLLEMNTDFFDDTRSSDLITRIAQNASATRDVLNTLVTSFGRDLLSVIGLTAVMVFQSPTMSLITLVLGPIIIVAVAKLSKRVRETARSEFVSQTAITSAIQETTLGIRVVKAFGLEEAMRGRMQEAVDSVRRRANRIAALTARTSPLTETLGGFAYSGLLLWAGYAVIYQGQKPGAFVAFMMALLLAYEPAKRLARTKVKVEAGLVGVALMYELLDTKPTLAANKDGPALEIRGGEVSFEAVDFAYHAEAPLFRKLDFVARAGETTALVGPSGAGKSTMIALIERLYDVQGGTIRIDGQDIAKLRVASLRAHMALVSQDVILFRATIRENIRFGRPEASDSEVEQAARDAMAHDFIVAMPEGYDSMIGGQGTQLSGGQRQRLAIARAILRDAPIILLDEATSSLDSESEYQIQVAFDRLVKGRTTIVIAHRLSTILHADKICVLVDGHIVEEGSHADLFAAGGQYARLYHLQFEKPQQAAARMTTPPAADADEDAAAPAEDADAPALQGEHADTAAITTEDSRTAAE